MTKAAPTLFLLALLALFAGPAYAQTQTPPDDGGVPSSQPPPTLPIDDVPTGTAFDGNGMWVWYLSKSNRGNLDSIAARARRAGVTTLFIKSSDGPHVWNQFSSSVVKGLHARGLRACAWGYVYGRHAVAEARVARTAIKRGADCFVIDAEIEYEGRYAAADKYMRKLRSYAGVDYPIGVAPFPYVFYHPAYPYSVFLGPYGAQFNLPQMYWRAIGTSVPKVFENTYSYSSLYARPIYPIGQTYGGVQKKDVVRFRRYAQVYGARGESWWSWQATPSSGWSGLASPLDALPAGKPPRAPLTPTLTRGARGDFVVWAQQHLLSAGQTVSVNGVIDKRTVKAILAFQDENALEPTGALDPATWSALLEHPAAKVRWRSAAGGASAARAGSLPPPRSATLPPVRNELRGAK
jgi:hypothetical protein